MVSARSNVNAILLLICSLAFYVLCFDNQSHVSETLRSLQVLYGITTNSNESFSGLCNVLDYGAVCDGVTNDTVAIQGMTCISGPLSIRNNSTTLILAPGTTLKAGPKWENTPFLYASNLHDVAILGGGTVEGSGEQWWTGESTPGRPKLIVLENCTNIIVSDIILLNAAMFHLELLHSRNAVVQRVVIRSPDFSIAPNTDGIDVGADGAWVHHCNIRNGDDSIVIKEGGSNVLVEDCILSQGFGPNIGTGNLNSRNITFRNIYTETKWGIRIKFKPGQSGSLTDVLFDNITIVGANKGIDIDQWGQSFPEPNWHADVSISNVTFRNIFGSKVYRAGEFKCSTGLPCTDLWMLDVHIDAKRRFECWNAYGEAVDVTPRSCFWHVV